MCFSLFNSCFPFAALLSAVVFKNCPVINTVMRLNYSLSDIFYCCINIIMFFLLENSLKLICELEDIFATLVIRIRDYLWLIRTHMFRS